MTRQLKVVHITIFAMIMIAAMVLVGLYGIAAGWLGRHQVGGNVHPVPVPAEIVRSRQSTQDSARASFPLGSDQQILFGDLHVHTAFSTDAFMMMLPLGDGGTRPPSDACDFARYCSALDFWSINDHAESLTPRLWRETVESIRQCNAVAGDPDNPDLVAFLGWEWSQVGAIAAQHFGHKNIVLRHLDEDNIPTRPIASNSTAGKPLSILGPEFRERLETFFEGRKRRYLDLNRHFYDTGATPLCASDVNARELPANCIEVAPTPEILYRKLDEWAVDALVIPHGTAWGFNNRLDIDWATQLTPGYNDPGRQRLVEIYSDNGNSEEYRNYENVAVSASGERYCPPPQGKFVPQCWRAGEIAKTQCLRQGRPQAECAEVENVTRAQSLEIGFPTAHDVPGATAGQWLDAGQCPDCFLPTYSHIPKGSVQYILALSKDHQAEPQPMTQPNTESAPQRFRFGFIGSSDNHKARPGAGYKDFDRRFNTDFYDENAWFARIPILKYDIERAVSYFLSSGLAAVHAHGRDRQSIWDALDRKEVYATSGDRILLWFDLINGPNATKIPMGSQLSMQTSPQFRVTAVGAFKQNPGCPEHTANALSADQVNELCRGECYNPSDQRKLITRIEVVKISPQVAAQEPVADLIADPWLVHECEPTQLGCTFTFEDPSFVQGGRDTLYYVRAIEEPSEAFGGDPLRCQFDSAGVCISVDPCGEDENDQCLAPVEERAWSSPIFVDWQASSET